MQEEDSMSFINRTTGYHDNITHYLKGNQGFNKLPTQYQAKNYERMRPKTVKLGKERMYEQILHLKSINNILEERNLCLKTELQTVIVI